MALKKLAIAAARSGVRYARTVFDELTQRDIEINGERVHVVCLETVRPEALPNTSQQGTHNFADSSLYWKISGDDIPPDKFAGMHVFLIQTTIDPFTQNPCTTRIKDGLEKLLIDPNLDREAIRTFIDGNLRPVLKSYCYDSEGVLKDDFVEQFLETARGYHALWEALQTHKNPDLLVDLKSLFRGKVVDIVRKNVHTRYVSDNLLELYGHLANLRDHGVRNLTTVLPWPEGGRQDRDEGMELIVAKHIAEMIRANGGQSILSIGVHSRDRTRDGKLHYGQQYYWEEILGKDNVTNIRINDLLVDSILNDYGNNLDNLVFIGPDLGSAERTIELYEMVMAEAKSRGLRGEAHYVIFEKERPRHHKVGNMAICSQEIDYKGGKRSAHNFYNRQHRLMREAEVKKQLKGKIFAYRDDMIDTSGTFKRLTWIAHSDFEYDSLVVYIDHLPMSHPGIYNLDYAHQLYQRSRAGMTKLVTTDTIYHPELAEQVAEHPWFNSISPIRKVADAIVEEFRRVQLQRT